MDTGTWLFFVAFLCFWGAAVVAGASLADNKGLNFYLGGLLGFLFGPLGLLLVAVIPSNRRTVIEREERLRRELRA